MNLADGGKALEDTVRADVATDGLGTGTWTWQMVGKPLRTLLKSIMIRFSVILIAHTQILLWWRLVKYLLVVCMTLLIEYSIMAMSNKPVVSKRMQDFVCA
jgi:hypothetical protein